MPPSGSKCDRSGIYYTGCHCGCPQTFYAGQVFPSCPSCSLQVNWILIGTFAGVTHQH